MIVLEIIINKLRQTDSIKLNINDNLVDYLSKEEIL
jgi:site-specific DNA recombinase